MQRTLYTIACACVLPFTAAADSLFNQQVEDAGTLIAEPKARFEEGDIITVLVREEITASTESDTRTRKESDVESQAPPARNPFLVGNPEDNYRGGIFQPNQLPNWEFEAENEHRGRGQTRRTSELITTVTCVVTEVHRNGNLSVSGEKKLSVNREDTTMKLSGMVRAKDVTPANTIESRLLHHAEIELKGKGPLWNNQRRGLITRFLDWFSPF